jgi:hypothetical protein
MIAASYLQVILFPGRTIPPPTGLIIPNLAPPLNYCTGRLGALTWVKSGGRVIREL